MLTTKRYEYMPFDSIQIHPLISNHRPLKPDKVSHLERDILKNGLLEPLIVWERANGEYYMVGGFHRLSQTFHLLTIALRHLFLMSNPYNLLHCKQFLRKRIPENSTSPTTADFH